MKLESACVFIAFLVITLLASTLARGLNELPGNMSSLHQSVFSFGSLTSLGFIANCYKMPCYRRVYRAMRL